MFLKISQLSNLEPDCFYIVSDGKLVTDYSNWSDDVTVDVRIRLRGGKGGFGSLLRSFGNQFYRATNTDMCRDLSGRRLGDVKQEEKLRKWIEKATEREKEREEKRRQKVQRLLQGDPKHMMEDDSYFKTKEAILESNSDAIEQGLKAGPSTLGSVETVAEKLDRKRPTAAGSTEPSSKKRAWIGNYDDVNLSGSDNSDDSDLENDLEELTADERDEVERMLRQFAKDQVDAEGNAVSDTAKNDQTTTETADIVVKKKEEKIIVPNTDKIDYEREVELRNAKRQKRKEQTTPVVVSEDPIPNLSELLSRDELEKEGLETLKLALVYRGLKCGGTLEQRVERLWSIRNMKPDEYPTELLVKKN